MHRYHLQELDWELEILVKLHMTSRLFQKKRESDLLYDYFGQGQLPRENHDALMTTRAEKKIKREVPVELHMHACGSSVREEQRLR